jgi:deazaflavin-dependent oxidoreductase (nitroreductase family)
MRRFFHFMNKFFMVPLFRLGFGIFFGNPFSGYIMVLKVRGRKSGKTRYAPVNYAIADGKVWCIAGFGRKSDWYRNALEHPDIEAILPGGAVAGFVSEVSDAETRLRVMRAIFKNAGFAGFFEGFNPYRISDAEFAARTAHIPLVCLQPQGLGSGASDPGGWAWIGAPVALALLVLIFWAIFR